MKNFFKSFFWFIPLFFIICTTPVQAHQPRIVEGNTIDIVNPEISKAYYAQLSNQPQTYTIESAESFNLYVNILLPYTDEQTKDVTATIFKNKDYANPIATLGGEGAQWKYMFEKFGYDEYWQGSEYRLRAGSGSYEIRVSSQNNNSKYSLAVGEIENFDLKETMNALSLVPKIKRDFFNESSISFIASPFGWGIIVVLFIGSFVFGILLRLLLKRIPLKIMGKKPKNIGLFDRGLRFGLGLFLLIVAITTSWNLFMIFAAGFCFFEALFSWCILYAAIGRDTCPIER